MYQFSSVAQLCLTLCNPMIAACQASLSITNSQSSHIWLIQIALSQKPTQHCKAIILQLKMKIKSLTLGRKYLKD